MILLSLQLTLIRQRGEGIFFDVGQQKSQKATRNMSLGLELKNTTHIASFIFPDSH